MKYLLLIFLFILTSCSFDRNLVNSDESLLNKSSKESEILNITLSEEDFRMMSFEEFDLFLRNYSSNSYYPDINN